jgi:hypothetical protein
MASINLIVRISRCLAVCNMAVASEEAAHM